MLQNYKSSKNKSYIFSHQNIKKTKLTFIFGLAKNGVKILSKDGKEDCFVLNQSDRFKKLLNKKPNNHSK